MIRRDILRKNICAFATADFGMSKSRLFFGITTAFVRNTVFGLVFGFFAADTIRPALAADAFNGKRLAEQWCAACHVVAVNQRQANADAPPFEEIARRQNFSERGLATFLLDPHGKMPNMNLTRIEAGDIAAYVGTLR